jgi:hypothetical protein
MKSTYSIEVTQLLSSMKQMKHKIMEIAKIPGAEKWLEAPVREIS